jgi:hypothetical protein
VQTHPSHCIRYLLNPMFRAHSSIFLTKDSTTSVLSILNTIWDLEYFGWWTTFRPSEEDWFLHLLEKGEASPSLL